MLWKPTFKFSRGPMKNQVTSERMNHILDGVKMAQPSASGHVGMTVNQTPDGWVGKVLTKKPTLGLWGISTSGLEATIGSGRVTKWEPVNSRKEQDEVTADNVATSNVLTLTASSTNYVYLKATMTPNATATNYIAWVASAYDFYTATSAPGNTVDFSDAVSGAGILYTKIATLVTNTSLVTSTTRYHWDAIDLAYPWTLNLNTFACPE
jgi:hypothetical protein